MIKRILCLLFVVLLVSMPICQVSASESAQLTQTSESTRGTIDISCIYAEKSAKINISGTVSHDLFVSHKDHKVRLYQLSPSQFLEDELDKGELLPIAESDISIKVNFSIPVKSIEDVFSKFVIVLVSSDGSIDYVSSALYPSVESRYRAPLGNKEHYKGINVSTDFSPIKGMPSLVVIDIDINAMQSLDFMGYLYTINEKTVFFDREYIDDLDLKINTLAMNDIEVYFRIIHFDEEGRSSIPDCGNVDELETVYAVCDFLADRYNSHQYGELSGFVIGQKVDVALEGLSEEEAATYIERLGLYTTVASNALRGNIPTADVVIPISDNNSYSSKRISERYGKGSDLIEGLCEFLGLHYGDDFDFSLMLETSLTPYGIDNTNIDPYINLSVKTDSTRVATHNIGDFVLYLDSLDDVYENAPKTFMYYWSVDGELAGNALACAYSYTYYKLFIQKTVSAFVVDFGDAEGTSESFADVYNIFKYIDTESGERETSHLLTYFDIEYWGDIISPTFKNHNLITREHFVSTPMTELPVDTSGEFYFFNYTDGVGSSYWYEGVGAKGLFIDYSSTVGRALRAEFEHKNVAEYSYLMWKDTFPENYEFTPYLAFNFCIEKEGPEKETEGLFEVRIEIGNGTDVIECTTAVMSRKASTVILDISEFAERSYGDYIKIAIRPISHGEIDYSLYLSSIVGYSEELDSEELSEAIMASRKEIRDQDSLLESLNKNNNTDAVLITTVVVALILGVMLFFFLRHDDGEEKDEQ